MCFCYFVGWKNIIHNGNTSNIQKEAGKSSNHVYFVVNFARSIRYVLRAFPYLTGLRLEQVQTHGKEEFPCAIMN